MALSRATKSFLTEPREVLAGSEKTLFPAPAEVQATGRLTVSVVVRRKNRINTKQLGKVRFTRAEYADCHGADRADLQLVHAFAKEFGLTVEKSTPKPAQRTVMLSGTVAQMQKAFGVELKQATAGGQTFRVREGSIHLPASLAPVVVAVLGLDNRPQARPHFRVGRELAPEADSGVRPAAQANNPSYTPVQVGQMYSFPAGASAAGQTIGIIELGGGYRTGDIAAYFKTLNQKPPAVKTVSVDKGKNAPTNSRSADGEVMLDIEVAAAVAPGAKVVVYFAPNTDQGFIDAIATAVHDTVNKPSVISISWGGPESSWTQQSLNALDQACQSAAALGISITAAAGDEGSTDGQTDGKDHVDFPASSPHVLACGGTKLVGSGSTITSEVVWNELAAKEGATGGGVSSFFALPTWQAKANVPVAGTFAGRGVPDVAGDADPVTGYVVRVDGQSMVIGGTSAVAPLWAGLIALANAQNKKAAGFFHPAIYAAKANTCFNDIKSGTNGTYSAGPGWDACTGLGSPIGTALIQLLGAAAATSTPGKAAKRVAAKKAAAKKQATKKVRAR
ncbi:MAG: S53 family peptidase [Acidobacteriaceae bacterium]